jgi:hypothetical protein
MEYVMLLLLYLWAGITVASILMRWQGFPGSWFTVLSAVFAWPIVPFFYLLSPRKF